jgi:hypothetical protein
MCLSYSAYGSWNGNTAGNGIASSYPIHSYSNQQSSLICQDGTRSFLQCCIDSLQKLTFAVTYLDEDVRLTQINEFNPCKPNIDIPIGDIREDYSDEYFKEIIIEKRENFQWEKSRFDLTKLITNQLDYQDAFKLINPQQRAKTNRIDPNSNRHFEK